MDRDEPKKLFLGTIRGDDNTSRHRLLDTISISLNDYGMCSSHPSPKDKRNSDRADNFVESTERAMARAFPKARDLANLQNWVDNTASLPFEETSYLRDEQDDLFSLSAAGRDEVLRALEGHLEDATFHVQRIMRKVGYFLFFVEVSFDVSTVQIANSGKSPNSELTYRIPRRKCTLHERFSYTRTRPSCLGFYPSHLPGTARGSVGLLKPINCPTGGHDCIPCGLHHHTTPISAGQAG